MATYQADRKVPGVQAIELPAADTTVVAVFSLTAALALNDVIQMMDLPTGAYVLDVIVASSAPLDTNAASTIALEVGDSALPTRYIPSTVQGNNRVFPLTHMGAPSTTVGAALGYRIGTNAGDNTILVTVATGPATAATTGTIIVGVTYSMEARTPSA